MNRRKPSARQWIIIVVGLLLVLLIGARLHLKWRVHQAIAELREQGKPTSRLEFESMQEPVPDEENAALLLRDALEQIDFPSDKEIELLPVIGLSAGSDLPTNWSEAVSASVDGYLDRVQEGVEMLMDATEHSRYHYRASIGEGNDMLHYARSKRSAAVLRLYMYRAIRDLEWETAVRSNVAQYRLANHLAEDGSVIGMLVRSALLAIALADTNFLLGHPDSDSADMGDLQRVLGESCRAWSVANTVVNERAYWIEAIVENEEELELTMDFGLEEPGQVGKTWQRLRLIGYRMSGLGDQDLLYLLDVFAAQEAAANESLQALDDLVQNWGDMLPSKQDKLFHYWSEMALTVSDRAYGKWIESQDRLRATSIAVAVARYRVINSGNLPKALSELVPKYLEELPKHPVTEADYELKETGHGYAIGAGAPIFTVEVRDQPGEDK